MANITRDTRILFPEKQIKKTIHFFEVVGKKEMALLLQQDFDHLNESGYGYYKRVKNGQIRMYMLLSEARRALGLPPVKPQD